MNLVIAKNVAQDASMNSVIAKNVAQDASLNLMPTLSGANIFTNTNYFYTISEIIITTSITSNAITCDYSLGGIFQISSQPNANFTANITNLPSILTSTKTFIISLIYTPAASYYCSAATVNGSSTTFLINGGGTSVSNSGKLTIQQLMFYNDGTTMKVLSNVSAFFL
jgi:hypothetical protein